VVELIRNTGPVPLLRGRLILEGGRIPDDLSTLLPPASEATIEVFRHSPS
jgi:hypothetical protein